MEVRKTKGTFKMEGKAYQKSLKRVIDILSSLILLVIFSPISIAAALAIKLDSPGTIFADVPERIGEKGRKFKMYKFRSMIVNAHYLLRTDPRFKKLFHEYKKSSYKLKKDPRITWVGKFIRRHSIDEIPQLINVFKGEMSLVGPRAYYPDELENQLKEYPHTKKLVTKVLSVKPGITGLWQVSGRSEVNFDKRIAIDADYVDNISLGKDLKIILKTPIIMVSGKGAI
ncbi:MAG: Undecaprenyl-phosphate galactose phosphotransferase [Candidatus Roizmanbacteria bacterium GW2011_GWC2_37_13]|uniref:Undecaprenyl-phosphate galactose phosphotransferase n=1 Tax=Candidatus Roizmanbacteria bacterium GW2011_GWC2_37_13 TaxID=1618486 RepID=A0A0G0G9G0_9BACT|nr:MAG: undecaprenyl-phosphate galactose phosphotransferase [Candidatus Roizmanbacteria bacterium GW2011_GWC1_37_12]KKQ26607.1 MAG: Undecaprenyl-phosphate galactose phosphotransferase [Candidatus Roizmanbacteria bacterium GW2011_GWC2_37_13]